MSLVKCLPKEIKVTLDILKNFLIKEARLLLLASAKNLEELPYTYNKMYLTVLV